MANKWMGKCFHQWIEKKLVEKKGWDWWIQNRHCDFSLLQTYSQKNKFECPDYEYRVLNDIRSHGIPVEHQVIYLNRFIADIALERARVVLELNGPYHEHKIQAERDDVRKELFNLFGFTVITWDMPISETDYQIKLGSFCRAYIRFSEGAPLRPILRPHAIEKISTNGMIQKALELKKRNR